MTSREKNLDIMASALLEEMGGSLRRRMARSADELWAGRFDRLLTPLTTALFSHARFQTECNHIAIWLLDEDEEELVPVHFQDESGSEIEQEILSSKVNAVSKGVLSLVCASGQSVCENDVQQNPYHNRTLDRLANAKARDVMITPLQFAGRLRGVVSFVRTENHPKTDGFNATNFRIANLMTNAIQSLIDHHLVESILGWE